MKEYTLAEKLDRIYDELGGMLETTALTSSQRDDLNKLINLIDDIQGR